MPRRIAIAAPNLMDRVVGWIAPGRAVERLAHRTQLERMTAAGGYNAGRRDRRPTKRWLPGEGAPDADTLPGLPDLRARSRDLARNTPIATGALLTTTTNVVGDGLQLQASIDHEALGITPEQADQYEREQEREFAVFCQTVDFTRVQCFDEMQELAFYSGKESGDIVGLRRYRRDPGDVYGTKLQLLEADRLSNPNRTADTDTLAGGVETDTDGVPVAYHISDRHPGSLRTAAIKWDRVPARTDQGVRVVLHLFKRTRPELTRGVPYLAPVIEHLKQLGDYSDAEVTAAVVGAMVTMVVQSPADNDQAPIVGETDSTLADNEVKLGNGAVISLNPGETAALMNPTRPNANFDPFVQAFLRQVGVALELPFELLIKHFTASYSASRAALAMAFQFFLKERYRFAERFCQEVYGWFMEEAVASGRLNRPGFFADPAIRQAWLGTEWIGPAPPSLMPKQEADADKVDIDTGVKTREQVCLERTGGKVEKKTAQLAKEQKLRDDAGLKAPAPAAPPGAPQPDDPAADDEDPGDKPQAAAPRRFMIQRPDGTVIRGAIGEGV
jgi:lambda family phage portal protein